MHNINTALQITIKFSFYKQEKCNLSKTII